MRALRLSGVPKSHQRSWWIVHTWPTSRPQDRSFPNPTNAVGGLFIFGLQARSGKAWVPNPTNAVGGSFIFCLQSRLREGLGPKSHQRSCWIFHILPTSASPGRPGPQIPPTQLVDRSYSAYKRVSGKAGSQIPPTQLVDRSYSAYKRRSKALSRIPPRQLVDRSYSAYKSVVFLVAASYARSVYLEPYKEISWAYQLHYHICFRTYRRHAVFNDQSKLAFLSQQLTDLSKINGIHLLEKDCKPEHIQMLLSLRPDQLISDALKQLKGRSSAATCQRFELTPPLWARGYLARSAGRVNIQAVKQYLANQAEHHGYDKRVRPPVFKFKENMPKQLATAHSSFELSHHFVFATRFRHGVFNSKTGQALLNYWLNVATRRGFAIDQATVLPDHLHMLVRITPKITVEQVALSLMNNGQFFMAKHFPLALIEAKIDRLWQPSAYAGTCGELSTALLKAFLRSAN